MTQPRELTTEEVKAKQKQLIDDGWVLTVDIKGMRINVVLLDNVVKLLHLSQAEVEVLKRIPMGIIADVVKHIPDAFLAAKDKDISRLTAEVGEWKKANEILAGTVGELKMFLHNAQAEVERLREYIHLALGSMADAAKQDGESELVPKSLDEILMLKERPAENAELLEGHRQQYADKCLEVISLTRQLTDSQAEMETARQNASDYHKWGLTLGIEKDKEISRLTRERNDLKERVDELTTDPELKIPMKEKP